MSVGQQENNIQNDASGVNPLLGLGQPDGDDGAEGGGEQTFGGGIGGELAGTEGSSRQSLQSGVAVLLFVLAVAGGVLFLMRKFGHPGLDFVLPTIDYPVGQAASARVDDPRQQRILRALESGQSIVQVPLDELQRNPFALDEGPSGEEVAINAPTGPSQEEIRARERQTLIRRTYEALELNSVVTGSAPIARISGRAYRLGDTIADLFKIVAIKGRQVTLEADGRSFTLVLGQQN